MEGRAEKRKEKKRKEEERRDERRGEIKREGIELSSFTTLKYLTHFLHYCFLIRYYMISATQQCHVW
jgi:hypothetical protein